ncbi:uncharacterized protein LOC113326359 [Papaver somniferum]|uniref:uncharacterized protein LOC113326359 n=1 Tax=Papaver somniferum TaxID=3469 RepID=UPI000E705A1C|nr:uncharacterized protein LOC113326359 [Papaver somniferum]
MVIPEEHDTTELDYAQLCPPITKLGDLPAIDLSTCSLNTQPVVNSYGIYDVPADNYPNNNDVRNNSHLNIATSNLDSYQNASQSGDDTNASLGGGSDSTTQVNQPFATPLIETAKNTINQFPVNNINLIAWNIRGFGKKSSNKELSLLCRNVNPDIIFLSETKMNKDMDARKLKKNMGFPCTFNVPNIGRSGGLALSWKKEIHLNIVSSSMRGIYVTSIDIIYSKTCHIHFMYGEPNSRTEDKNGGLEVDDPDFETLRNFFYVFNLHDPAEDLCPKLCVNNLPRDSYDHCPMHIGLNYEDIFMPRPFHFMAMWIGDPTCRDIIANSWSVNVVGSPAYRLKAKLLITKKGLRDWNKSSFGNIQTNISIIMTDLAELQLSNPTDTSNTSRFKARFKYLCNLEELYWKDKSREVWLMEGDKNSLYFHRVTLFRRKRNAISWIKNSLNTILTDRDSIGTSFIDYLKNLYSSHPQQFQDEILVHLPIKFSAEDNTLLNMPLSPEEIKNDVFQMGGKKAPGPDGFTFFFIENTGILWEMLSLT